MFLSFDMAIPNDSFTFKFNNTTHQSQTNTKESTFNKVSSKMNSLIFLLLDDIFCWGLYFWIHQFQIDTWFLLIKCKDSIWEAFLNDNIKKLKIKSIIITPRERSVSTNHKIDKTSSYRFILMWTESGDLIY